MKLNVYFGVAIRIIILCAAGMAVTFVNPYLREFWGDVPCDGSSHCLYDSIDRGWVWGARHYWYAWMTVLLFIWSAISVVISGYNLITKNYKF